MVVLGRVLNRVVLQFLELQERDLLRFAIFGNGEIVLLQPFDGITLLVFGKNVHHYQLDRIRKAERLFGRSYAILAGILFGRGGFLLPGGRWLRACCAEAISSAARMVVSVYRMIIKS